MGTFIKGDVVVLPFPFTDLSSAKRRPALILSDITGDDYIMLQITSKNVNDKYAIPLAEADLISGSLHLDSNLFCEKRLYKNRYENCQHSFHI